MFWKKGQKIGGKAECTIFVDYEHWYYSYKNIFNMRPNVTEWENEIAQDYRIKDMYIFGDFSEYGIGTELEKLEKLTKNVIHTTSTKEGVDKDFTDFIMLDYMYQKAVEAGSSEVFIVFTGDGHFDSVIKYLRAKLHKKVIVYGVKRAFSGKLKSIASSYVEMPRYVQEQQYYYNLILGSLSFIENQPGKRATYWKTVRNVAEHNGLLDERIQSALDDLMGQKYISEVEISAYNGKMRVLDVNWNKLKKDGIFSFGKV